MRFSWQSNINNYVSEIGDTWRSSRYFNEFQKEEKAKYKGKLTLTNGQLLPDPYGVVENMKSDTKLIPDVSWGNMYNYIVNSPSEYTYDNVKAWKFPTFLCAIIFKTFIIMKLQKNLNFAVSKKGTKIFKHFC